MNRPLATTLFSHRYVPAPVPGSRAPLTVVLHGLGDSLNGWSFLPAALRLPEMSYLFLNAPDPYYGGFSWYDFQGDMEPGVVRSRGLLLELLEELEAQGVHASNVFLLGFSQGCLMSVDVALHAPKPLAGVVGISGYVGFPEQYPAAFGPAAKSQRLLVTHGELDPVVPFEPAKAQFETLEAQGISLEFRAYPKVHTVLPEELEDIAAWMRERLGNAR